MRSLVVVCDGAGLTGGTERVATATATGFADRGWRVGFFGGEGALSPAVAGHAGIESHSMELADAYHAGSKAELLRRFFYNREAGAALGRFLNGWDPEETTVHMHSFRRVLTASVVRAAKARGFRQVATLHDFGIADPNTGFYDFPRAQICPLKPMSPACWARQCTKTGRAGKAVQMARATVNAGLRVWESIESFVHVSPFSARILAPYVPKGRPQTVVDNPVSVARGPRVEAEGNAEFVFVGRLEPEKGPALFAAAARRAGVRAIFVGEGPERGAILAANPEAEMTGWLSPEGVGARIARARAAVFPSRWYETAGLGALEALARGVPVIVSDACAAREYVADGATGRWFASGDEGSLTGSLAALAAGDVRALSEAAYARYWADPFTLDRYLDRIEAVYAGSKPGLE